MGRDDALSRAEAVLDTACNGRGGVAMVAAPSGFGKSALLAEVRERAGSCGMECLSAAGRWYERDFAFAGVLELFESRLDAAEPAERERFLADAAGEAVPIFTPGESIEPTFEVLHGLYRLCDRLADERPLALLIDDVDLADGPTLRFLAYLAERVSEHPVAIVVTCGSVPARFVPEAVHDIAWMSATQSCRLRELSVGETARRVRGAWRTATVDACGRLHQDSGGNPLIVDLLAAERFGDSGDAKPALAAWVLRRAARVHEGGPALLRAMSILGPGCDLRHVAALAGLDADSAASAVGVLTEAGILRPEERLFFTQPIVASAIEAAHVPGERAAAHLAAARMMSEDQASIEVASRHLLQASRTGSTWAVDCLCQAASLAMGRGAPREAVGYLRRALVEPPIGRQRAHVALELGNAEAIAGEPQAAARLSEAAEWAAAGPERPAQALATGRALFALGRPDQAMAVFEHGLGDVAGAQSPVAGQLRAGRAAAQWLTQLPEGGGLRSDPPPASADTPGDRAQLALLAMEGAVRGESCVEVRELAARALARGALLADETADGLTYYLAAAALAFAEDLQTAEAALTAAVEDARGRGSVLGFATASHVRAMTILMRGRVLDAASDARNALGAEPEGWRLGLGGARLVLAMTSLEAGDVAEAERRLDDTEVITGDTQPLRLSLLMTRGQAKMARGDAEGALKDFMSCGDIAVRAGVRNPAIAPWRSNAARALAATGDKSEGARLAEEELKLAEAFGAPAPIGRALRVLATVRDAQEELDILQSAVEVLEGSQAALERARGFVDLGAALRRSGRLLDARPHLRSGLDLAERCGAKTLAERAKRETKAAGARPRRTALTGPDSLTARERQVATLAATGLSNREIGEELFVTVKTIEWHLKHSYRKLGVSSRGGLQQFFGEER